MSVTPSQWLMHRFGHPFFEDETLYVRCPCGETLPLYEPEVVAWKFCKLSKHLDQPLSLSEKQLEELQSLGWERSPVRTEEERLKWVYGKEIPVIQKTTFTRFEAILALFPGLNLERVNSLEQEILLTATLSAHIDAQKNGIRRYGIEELRTVDGTPR